MALIYNFNKKFASAVKQGSKLSSIRRFDKHANIGDEVIFTCRELESTDKKLGTGTITGVYTFSLQKKCFWLDGFCHSNPVLLQWIANIEGFEDYQTMIDWFAKQYDIDPNDFYFKGRIHFWRINQF